MDRILTGDCLTHLAALPEGSVDLAFADPPFNIGYEYDVYDDRQAADDYLAWTEQWLAAVRRVLKPTGSFYVAIGDEYAAELKVRLDALGPDACATGSSGTTPSASTARRSSTAATPTSSTTWPTRSASPSTPTPSACRRPGRRPTPTAGPTRVGKLPDDTWVLRPQEEERCFQPDSDTWYVPRVCGTFKERTGHPCQMPEAVLERIIRVSSNPGDLVLDPFAGSGTTLATAKRLGRRYLGIELSRQEYAEAVRQALWRRSSRQQRREPGVARFA